MPANLENSAVTTGLEKVSFHSNSKNSQCQRMFKLLDNCAHFTCQLISHDQNPSSQYSLCEPRTSRCTSWIQKRQRNQKSNYQHSLDHGESKEVKKKKSTFASLTTLKSLTVWMTTNCGKCLNRREYFNCLLRNPYAGQEAMLEPDMEQWTGSKLGKEYVKAVYCHSAYLTYHVKYRVHHVKYWAG